MLCMYFRPVIKIRKTFLQTLFPEQSPQTLYPLYINFGGTFTTDDTNISWRLEVGAQTRCCPVVFEMGSTARYLSLSSPSDLEQRLRTCTESPPTAQHAPHGTAGVTTSSPTARISQTLCAYCKIGSTFCFMLVLSRGLNTELALGFVVGQGEGSYLAGGLLAFWCYCWLWLVDLFFKPCGSTCQGCTRSSEAEGCIVMIYFFPLQSSIGDPARNASDS